MMARNSYPILFLPIRHLKERDHAIFKFILEVHSNDHLKEIIARLKNIKSITNVYKLNEKVVIK